MALFTINNKPSVPLIGPTTLGAIAPMGPLPANTTPTDILNKRPATQAQSDLDAEHKSMVAFYRPKFDNLEKLYPEGKEAIENIYTTFLTNNLYFTSKQFDDVYKQAEKTGKDAKAAAKKLADENKTTLKQNSVSSDTLSNIANLTSKIEGLSNSYTSLVSNLDTIRSSGVGATEAVGLFGKSATTSTITTGNLGTPLEGSSVNTQTQTTAPSKNYTSFILLGGLAVGAFFFLKRKH